MTATAGTPTVVPYETTDYQTTSSTAASAETVAQTVTASVVIGEVYEITWHGNLNSTASGDEAVINIRTGTTTGGTQLDSTTVYLPNSSRVYPGRLYAEWTASATGAASFCLTTARAAGSGNVKRYANGNVGNRLKVKRKL
jgi:hypothetical protein